MAEQNFQRIRHTDQLIFNEDGDLIGIQNPKGHGEDFLPVRPSADGDFLISGDGIYPLPGRASFERPKTLAILGNSIPMLGVAVPNRRVGPATAYTWSAGVVTMTIASHALTVGATCEGDAQWDGGTAWSTLDVVATAVDANTLTFPLASDPGPSTADSLYFNFRPGVVSITGISHTSTSLTVTLASGVNLDTFSPGLLRVSFENCVGAAAATLNALSSVALLTCPSAASFTIYMASDPGALTSGKVRFADQFQGTQYSWPIALLQALGHPFKISHVLTCGAVRVGAIKGQAAYLASLSQASRPGYALVGGALNSLANSVTGLSAVTDIMAAADTLYRAGIVPILYDCFLASGLSLAGAEYGKYQRYLATQAKAKGYILLTGASSHLAIGATTPVPALYADSTPPITPPTTDNTHLQKYGAHRVAIAMADSPGGKILKQIRQDLPPAIGGFADNLLPNPLFNTRTGGAANAPATGTVPASWEVSTAGAQAATCVPINRALPSKWVALANYAIGDVVLSAAVGSQCAYVCTVAGKTGASEPAFPDSWGETVAADGTVTWMAINPAACDGKAGCWLQVTLAPPTALTISGVTQANPGVPTLSATTGLQTNKRGLITGVVGMTQLNNRMWGVSAVSTTPNLLRDDTNGNADTSAFTAYSSGGVFLPTSLVDISLVTALTKSGKWATGDELQALFEFQHDDAAYVRQALAQMSFTGVTVTSEMNASSYASQIVLPKDCIIATQPVIAPLEATAAAQTLDVFCRIELISGTFRIARPTLVNHTTA